jgi:hypothetical protein
LILLKPFNGNLGQPLLQRLPGGGVCLSNKTMPLEGQTAPSWWWCLWAVCFRCFASKKPSEREFFVPAGMDLAVKLLTEESVAQLPSTSYHGWHTPWQSAHYSTPWWLPSSITFNACDLNFLPKIWSKSMVHPTQIRSKMLLRDPSQPFHP